MKFPELLISRRIAWLGAFSLVATSGLAMAAEWTAEPSVGLKELYNDNIYLTTSPHNAVWQTTLSPALVLSGRSETLQVSGNAKLNFNKYSGEQGLNATDRIFGLSSSWNTERQTWGLNASYTLDSTLASELQTTGYVLARKQRRAAGISPSWTYLLSERLSVNLGYQYSDVKYDTAPNLTNYTYQQLNGVLQYMWSEQNKFFLMASSDEVDYATITYTTTPQLVGYLFPGFPVYFYGGKDTITGNKSQTHDVMFGVDHVFSESLHGSLKLGQRTTHSSAVHTCNGDIRVPECTYNDNQTGVDPLITFQKNSRSKGSSLEANLEQQFETGRISANASRQVNASGSGLVETSTLGLSMNNQFNQALTGTLNFSVYRTRYLGENVSYSNSRYYAISPGMAWRMSEWWTLNMGYQYTKSKADNTSLAATSSMAFVEAVYNWPKLSISR